MRYIWNNNNWTNFRWHDNEIVKAISKTRFSQGKLFGLLNHLNFDEINKAHANIIVEEAIKTAEIEGCILNKDSVRSSVARHLGLSTAGLPEPDRHTDGLVQVLIDVTQRYDRILDIEMIKGWQAALFPTGYSGLYRIAVGKWRGKEPMQIVSGPIGREKVHFEAPPHDRVEKEMENFIKWWNNDSGTLDGLLRAGIAHLRFVTIHPFEDGNGRIARALTDMALAQDEKQSVRFYSFSSQIMAQRKFYYNVLEKTQKGDGDITEWLLWFLNCLENAISSSDILIEKIFAKSVFWQKFGNMNLSDRQRKVINRLLDAGNDGFEGGLTTRKYVSMTKSSRATAYREISDLVNKGILKENQGKGRNVNYKISISAYSNNK